MHKLSICIPTYNRSRHLENCLQSIISNEQIHQLDVQVCVSDNCSTDETADIVRAAQEKIPINYSKNKENIGIARNFLKAVEMADSEFIWLVGDDDLFLPDALTKALKLIDNSPDVDFFFINSFHLTSDYVLSFPRPFQTSQLPAEMQSFSPRRVDGKLNFLDLINPRISFDYLGGIFLSVFRKELWMENVDVLDQEIIADENQFSHFDNTFPHIKIFANAFAKSSAYFHSESLTVCLSGARDWAPKYRFIRLVRLIEALKEYKKNGLPHFRYLKYKNNALRNFVSDFYTIYINREHSGYYYIKPINLILEYCLYPNFYFSAVRLLIRKTKKLTKRFIR